MNESVVVIGAGPQGLAAAAHLLERGLEPIVLEQGSGPAASVSEWGHVRLFSEWPELVDAASARLLAAAGVSAPTSGDPFGAEWVADYLAPLAAALGDRVRYGARVTGVARAGRDLLVDAGRDAAPFVVHVRRADGTEERIVATAVIDASGSWATPNPAGADGLPALGETAAAAEGLVSYRIPTPDEVASLAGAHTVVVGNGHSALGAIVALARVVREHPGTRVTWALRRDAVGDAFGGGGADRLAARGALGVAARCAVEEGLVELVTGFRTAFIDHAGDDVVVIGEDGRALDPARRVIALTGFRPDLGILSEVRLDLDGRLQAPRLLAAEIDPNIHSCGTVRATGAAELAHPEPGLYIVGVKSYGRAPTFLALTGYEQVRSVVAALAGDHEAAQRNELVIPETGVCGGAGLFDEPADASGAGGCCAPSLAPVAFGRIPVAIMA
ncbi:MAG: NAD(P)-binding domain-containing protein [Microcella sp.]|uniref:NAD(P)-binding domain-containing protein n=1 Tax=Microcella sp. TaxID=1913979 RepID=UPI00271D2C36|nr:NAD(P)-binding domain-containing protein [Microcella sp.]MDO8337712.1 NAD(P)-binding domain-containing protein [Microcella sp.]